MKISKGSWIFWSIVIVFVGISIGYDYIKYALLKSNHRYTIGYVTDYKGFVREYNNRIHYTYTIDGKEIEAKFRSRDLDPGLKGKRILVMFSPVFKFVNEPKYSVIIPDSVSAPESGWVDLPVFLLNDCKANP